MKKILTITLILALTLGLVGCSQINKVEDTIEIGRTFNQWFNSLEGNNGSMIENMVHSSDEILYPTDLIIDITIETSDTEITVNKKFDTREELVDFLDEKKYVQEEDKEDWISLLEYRLTSLDNVIIKNSDGEKVPLTEKSLTTAKNILTLVSEKYGNSRDLYAVIENLSLYNNSTDDTDDFSGDVKLTFTEMDDGWYIQKVVMNLSSVQ